MKAILYLCSTCALLLAQAPSIEQSLSMKTAGSAQISPNGQYVAYTVQEANWEQNEFVPQIWIARVADGSSYPLTHSRRASDRPRWSPDSKQLAFTSNRDGKQQLYLISPTGGEAVQLTHQEDGVDSFDWSPDGKAIAFSSPGVEAGLRKQRSEKYGEFEEVDVDYTRFQLWSVREPWTAPAAQLTHDSGFTVENLTWSPDSRRIAFEAQENPGYAYSDTARIYIVEAAGQSLRKFRDDGLPNHRPVWSPDGKRIAFMTFDRGKGSFYGNVRITAGFDENARLLTWAAGGIYFGVFRLQSTVFRLDPSARRMERINPAESFAVQGASFTRDGSWMAGVATRPNRFAEIFVSPVKDFAPRMLTGMNAQWQSFKLGTREVIQWKSIDGTPIEGILIKPADYNPARKYPLLVVIHGGPAYLDTPALMPDRDYPVEAFVAKGALVLKPNYRGSTGYGEKFRSLNVRSLGLTDYQDVISGVDCLIGKGMVDKDRVGSMGWSQGGFISAFATTYGNRFKAVSVGAGVTDWLTYYVNTDIHFFTRQYLRATPWDDPEIYRRASPITYVKNARTPTLFQHGSRDPRVPPPNAFELYQALKDRGVPTRLILYTGFGHEIDKPRQQRAVMEHNYEWFSKYIWDEESSR